MRRSDDEADQQPRLFQSNFAWSHASRNIILLKKKTSKTVSMSAIIAGFICALVLSALVIAWIVYCMFFKERHKESVEYGISDLQHKNYQIAQETEQEKKDVKKEGGVGIFILPTRHKQKDDELVKRPDFPEGPVQILQPGADRLVEIFNAEAVDADIHNREYTFEIDASCQSAYHSDV